MAANGSTPTLSNGLIRCYNMFPSNFKNINEMTKYLTEVKALGMNVVWINPIQLAGNAVFEKSDPVTGQPQLLKGSLYAMMDPTLIDPRFSVVKRDVDGDMLLNEAQLEKLKKFKPLKMVEQTKDLREEIENLEAEKQARNREIERFKKRLNASNRSQLEVVQNKLKDLTKKLAEKKQSYQAHLALQHNCIRQLDGEAIKAFTTQAKQLGITPIFDLVFNHLSVDAPYIKDNSALFNFEDRTFSDTTAFFYSKLLVSKYSGGLSAQEREEIVKRIPMIIETFWKPYIQTYINEFGFCGARVDCVAKIPHELREPVYQLIREGVAKQADPMTVVIIEEALFSDVAPKEFVEKVKGANATHSIGSVYNRKRLWHGGLEDDYSNEDFYKKSMVQHGVVNFTGNHDHYSCAMTVCRELAFERLQSNKELYASFLAQIHDKEAANHKVSQALHEHIKSLYIHYYVRQIIAELEDPDRYNDTVIRFGKAYRDKVLTNVFSGSGGYYMLAGDEFASFNQPSVFLRANGEKVCPEKYLAIFDSDLSEIAYAVIDKMASQYIKAKKLNCYFEGLSAENRNILLSAIAEHILNEINANVPKQMKKFVEELDEALLAKDIDLDDDLLERIPAPLNYKNGWGTPKELKKFANPEFFQEINQIIEKLPASKEGFWSELFKAVQDDILIAVRVNGYGYAANVDVVISNLNPNKVIPLGKNDIHKIALWLQERGFPQSEGVNPGNPDFHRAYACIMGSTHYKIPPANLYFAGALELDKDIDDHFVEIDGAPKSFNIVVRPKKVKKDPLFAQGPSDFIQEEYSDQELLLMFKNVKFRQQPRTFMSNVIDQQHEVVEIKKNKLGNK